MAINEQPATWKVVKEYRGERTYDVVTEHDGTTIAYMFRPDSGDDARLIAAARNSYAKHCGPQTVACAESDLLGELLACLWGVSSAYAILMQSNGASKSMNGTDSGYTAAHWVSSRLQYHIDTARLAIAKAKGGA